MGSSLCPFGHRAWQGGSTQRPLQAAARVLAEAAVRPGWTGGLGSTCIRSGEKPSALGLVASHRTALRHGGHFPASHPRARLTETQARASGATAICASVCWSYRPSREWGGRARMWGPAPLQGPWGLTVTLGHPFLRQ